MQSMMLATDFSERSDRALRRAVLLARQTGARIHLVHVVDDDRPRRLVDREASDARALLDELASTLGTIDTVSCETHIIRADPFAGINEAVNTLRPDLLILGPHRRQLLKDAFVGTTAERTIRKVDCPVLMVNALPVAPYKQALLTTDLSDCAGNALNRFQRLQHSMNLDATIVHVFETPALNLAMADTLSGESQQDYIRNLRSDALRNLATQLRTIRISRLTEVVRPVDVSVAHEILATASDIHADVIVMSTHGRHLLARWALGSVTEQVLQASTIDVLTVPGN